LKVVLHTDEEGVFNGFKGKYTFDENVSINRGEHSLAAETLHTHTKHFFPSSFLLVHQFIRSAAVAAVEKLIYFFFSWAVAANPMKRANAAMNNLFILYAIYWGV
jgi:hypothetical protein